MAVAQVFGIGAQRAGTTWLYDALSGHPDCALPPLKELHFFDLRWPCGPGANTRPIRAARIREFRELANGIADELATPRTAASGASSALYGDNYLARSSLPQRMRRLGVLSDWLRIRNLDDYARYMSGLAEAKKAAVAGDITPAYSMLSREAYQEMSGRFPRSRFIFVMRDPVQRFLSQLRFNRLLAMRRGRTLANPAEQLANALADEDYLRRSDYRRTIETLESVVPPTRIHYVFFEEMTAPQTLLATMRRLEEFLGISARPAEQLLALAGQRSNASSAAAVNFSSEQLLPLRTQLAPVYEYVASRFPEQPARWQRVDET